MKMRKNMKTVLLMLLLCLSCLTVSAQAQKVSISLKNATLKQVFSAIEKQTTYRFSYRNEVVDNRRDISIERKDATVEQVLNAVLANRELEYTIVSQQSIVISDKPKAAEAPQQKATQVSGRVLDQNGEPIIGAGVYEKGTKNGAVTDIDGRFTLSVQPGSKLTVSYIGFTPMEVRAAQNMSIEMREDQQALDEVVVVGYGTMKKRDLTGARCRLGECQQRPAIHRRRLPHCEARPDQG